MQDRKLEYKKVSAIVRHVLDRWDPLTVVPNLKEAGITESEYESYVPRLTGIVLHRGGKVELQKAIEEMLQDIGQNPTIQPESKWVIEELAKICP